MSLLKLAVSRQFWRDGCAVKDGRGLVAVGGKPNGGHQRQGKPDHGAGGAGSVEAAGTIVGASGAVKVLALDEDEPTACASKPGTIHAARLMAEAGIPTCAPQNQTRAQMIPITQWEM